MKKKTIASVRAYRRLVEKGRKAYKDAEAVFQELLPHLAPGEVIEVDGKSLALVDNFAESNTAFRTASVRRFELKEVTFAGRGSA